MRACSLRSSPSEAPTQRRRHRPLRAGRFRRFTPQELIRNGLAIDQYAIYALDIRHRLQRGSGIAGAFLSPALLCLYARSGKSIGHLETRYDDEVAVLRVGLDERAKLLTGSRQSDLHPLPGSRRAHPIGCHRAWLGFGIERLGCAKSPAWRRQCRRECRIRPHQAIKFKHFSDPFARHFESCQAES
jgi:hypothetical protein